MSITAVPTNIITGFLGAGKTSAILHLLQHKPSEERWAVLVNEFGEIGVDGQLFQGQHTQEQGVFIREVPGGCMCCASGLPMQIALNQLLTRAKPDRLLIEPTGLGHPKEVLQVLAGEYYREVLSLQRVLTLVDARHLSKSRYTEHSTFNQQIAIADIVVGNKLDLYQPDDRSKLEEYIKQHGANDAEVIFTQNGALDPKHLQGETNAVLTEKPHHHHANEDKPLLSEIPIPECGYLKAVNEGEGQYSIGWRFSADNIFSREKLFTFFNGIKAERMKAVVITENGVFGYNLTPDALTEIELDDCIESRIEIIAAETNDKWQQQLMACIASPN
ncbi:CobW family GTP-binding protein [Agarilytica rhodophyticola]|uniref:CobW family GTP-binding protein n=1 Tax=Agarilytica rhodophyticola TaxID=1737490 RepID=UPI000B3443F6|nr:GTP-binding protein [Agarilytica rhodophyticola]